VKKTRAARFARGVRSADALDAQPIEPSRDRACVRLAMPNGRHRSTPARAIA